MSGLTGVGSSAQDLKSSYLNLLVTQLQNQNPLEPMSNDQMTAQLAQISQLEQMEVMNGTFEKVLAAEQGKYASSLIGKEVVFSADGEDMPLYGLVSSVEMGPDGLRLRVGDYRVAMEDVRAIADASGTVVDEGEQK